MGGHRSAAEKLNIPILQVYDWKKIGVPYKHHARVAEITGLSPAEIAATRPDHPSAEAA